MRDRNQVIIMNSKIDSSEKLHEAFGKMMLTFTKMLEAAPFGVAITNEEGVIQATTKRLQVATGYGPGELHSKDLTFLFKYSGTKPLQLFLSENCLEKVCVGELKTADGSTKDIEIRVSQMPLGNDQQGLILALMDPSAERIKLT